MANDKGDGEDLFEDLDKFFAPIRDVDWDEPEEPTGSTPHESHVEVRTEESSEATQEQLAADVTSPESDEGTAQAEPDDVWYEPGATEPAENVLGEEVAGDAERPDVVV